MNILKKSLLPIFLVVCTVFLWTQLEHRGKVHEFQGDDLRYISYAVSMHEHGIFGLQGRDIEIAPIPSNANAPLYPFMIAGAMFLNQDFANNMICAAKTLGSSECAQNFEFFFFIQCLLGTLTIFFVYLITFRLTKNQLPSYLAALLVLPSGILQEFCSIFMTEILILPIFCALLYCCILYYQHKGLKALIALSFILAILTLTRPSYLYLFYGFILFFVASFLFKPKKHAVVNLTIFISVFFLSVSPWVIRNKISTDEWSLTSGGYAQAILIQRTNYNQMSWPEVGAAMIYYLPDFGDSLAKKLFPEHMHNKLGWHENSYYALGYREQFKALSDELGGENKVLTHLIKEEILSIKHIGVSIPLAIRGVFIAKYWGLVGFLALCALLFQTIRKKDFAVLILTLPALYMVLFHAGLSVSIPRYNLPLLAVFSPALSIYLYAVFNMAISKKNRESSYA